MDCADKKTFGTASLRGEGRRTADQEPWLHSTARNATPYRRRGVRPYGKCPRAAVSMPELLQSWHPGHARWLALPPAWRRVAAIP